MTVQKFFSNRQSSFKKNVNEVKYVVRLLVYFFLLHIFTLLLSVTELLSIIQCRRRKNKENKFTRSSRKEFIQT